METLVKKYNNLSLRKYLVINVIITLGTIVFLSSLTVWGCMSFRKYLLPESNALFLTVDQTYADGTEHSYSVKANIGEESTELPVLISEDNSKKVIKYTVQRIENSIQSLTPKKKIAYHFCSVAMIVFPIIFSIAGILLCGFQFYKRKLSIPLNLLSEATKQILEQNLDFSLQYDCADEMGVLCRSFEQMRLTLYENYREMWIMLEERKLLQASIAHDLRNPIAIIEGYTEYLQINLKKRNLSEKRILEITEKLNLAVKRLENYTESVRTLNQMEDIEINQQRIYVSDLVSDIKDDLNMMVQKKNIHFCINNMIANKEIKIDISILYRVLENIFANALRYAKENVSIDFVLIDKKLSVIITDDGNGFSDEVLERQGKMFITKPSEDGHLGLGLAISRILCKKHGGSLEIYNNEKHSAVVKINFLI